MPDRHWWITLALSGACVVGLGAFAAHGLHDRLPERLSAAFVTGVRYQAWHTLAAMAVLAWRSQFPIPAQLLALKLWLVGVLLFSGSLYAMAMAGLAGAGLGPLGVITPIGGTLLLLGWLALAWGLWRQPR
ncbi:MULTISPECIES: DUF423 domain-containing protein [Halomonas]|uniref:DUF423 domain-containing protein n=1 Tax=Halomonas TaxID=2745 RepID=UPI001A8CD5C0|nr:MULTISPECIES: DUF423 domain-containing protein [Halomonas]MED5296612.1 DUF423 domain-containing protein [Pseudomonadota bacterium]MBN8412908.1 DUF423 domain-containing protein [Halomonas litopenaei]MBY5925224.1 DUF423 domain-containing protein [Halomonas sp. DP4Y7-2]MBY5929038.1 DUF423 domain-containing protein [Halomonas sp. DP8Y7-3]MBY5968131.1 DUF423 domain-containing protein [Halomonas denitrificans]